MNQKLKYTKIYLAVTVIILMASVNISKAGQAAPYTEEAYFKIENAQKEFVRPKLDKDTTPIERQKAAVEGFREIFNKAGFDFDSTIRKVARDLENNPENVPKTRNNVAIIVIISLSFMKSHCEYDRIDCLSLFDDETSESIKWLWGYTGFKP